MLVVERKTYKNIHGWQFWEDSRRKCVTICRWILKRIFICDKTKNLFISAATMPARNLEQKNQIISILRIFRLDGVFCLKTMIVKFH